MDAEASGDAPPESDLVVADIPEGQKPLICVEFPGGLSWTKILLESTAQQVV